MCQLADRFKESIHVKDKSQQCPCRQRVAKDQPSTDPDDSSAERLTALDFVLSLFALTLMSITGFTTGRSVTGRISGGVRAVLGSVVAGLTGYVYYGVGGPGAQELTALLNNLAPMVTTIIGGLVGFLYTRWTLRTEYG